MNYSPSGNTIEFALWCKLYLPQEDNTTPVYQYKMVDFLFNTPGTTKNIKSFRGSAKSITTCKLALYRIVSGLNKYVLIVSDTALQGEALIMDIVQMIQFGNIPGTELVRAIAGEIELKVNGIKAYILSKGAGASMRGIKRGSMRADLCITDDLMNDQVAMNKVRMDRLKAWYFKVLRPSLSPKAEIWNVGTPLNQGDIFMQMCELHPTFSNPLSLESWPDRFTPEWIERTRQEYKDAGQLRSWKQEFELVLTDDETRIFQIDKIQITDTPPDDLTWFCTLDGAFSEKDSADYSAFAVVGIDAEGRWYVASYGLKADPSMVVDKLFELQAMYGFQDVGIEKGSFRLAIQSEVDRRMAEYQQWFSVSELSTTGSKITRIKALAPIINSGRLTIVDTGEDAELLMEQITMTDNMAVLSSHDDHIDALCQMVQMNLYYNEPHEYTREDYRDIPFVSNYSV